MKLLVKQRVFSWTDSYDVYDENENAKYFVKAEFLSLGHRLHVYDMAGNELGLIKEKVMSLLPVFEIEVNGQTLGRIEKRFTLFRPDDLIEAAEIDGANKIQTLFKVTIPMMMPSITICMFLSITNGFKLFDQNLSLTAGEPSKMSEMMALNIFNTFYGRTGWEGVGQAKAVIFFAIVVVIGMIQLRATRSKEVQQ